MKRIILLLEFLILILPILSAVEFNMNTEFGQGETLIATVSGNFIEPIQKENVFFYRGHVKVPIDYNVVEIDNDFYIYALLTGKESNNYSVRLENIKYKEGADISEKNIIKNFTITNSTADFSVNPGFIISDKSFSLEVQNLQNFKIEIEINENKTESSESKGFFDILFKGSAEESGNTIELKSGEIKNLEFNLGNETSFRIVELKSENTTYDIPVYVFVNQASQSRENESGNGIPSEEESPGTSVPDNEEIKIAKTETCEELEGIVCNDNEQCDTDSVYAIDAVCCTGSCNAVKKDNTGKIIGWLMIGIIIIAVILFFRKKSHTKRNVNLLDVAKGKK